MNLNNDEDGLPVVDTAKPRGAASFVTEEEEVRAVCVGLEVRQKV